MTKLPLLLAVACLAPAAGCIIDNGSNHDVVDTCTTEPAYSIDSDATFTYTAGVDAGYYITYVGAGAWHLEWTCDTNLSADGCTFSGTIYADLPASGANATCFECEANDELSSNVSNAVGPNGEAQMEIDFNTVTTTGVDGVDFQSVAGSSIDLDIQTNGLYQPDIINFVSATVDAAPACVPFELTPPND